MTTTLRFLGLATFVVSCGSPAVVSTDAAEPPPRSHAALLDGDCSEYSTVLATLDHGVVVYELQGADHLWLGVDLPDGSYGTGEFVLETPALATPLVLHVSAQLGEWSLGEEVLRPTNATSDLWWNNVGWTALTARFNGTEPGEDGSTQVRFLPTGAQEFQFDKRRFGPGPWTLTGSFWSVSDGAGGFVRVALDDGTGAGLVLAADG